jgi:putative nucleotidyltransferase with HDIG domain
MKAIQELVTVVERWWTADARASSFRPKGDAPLIRPHRSQAAAKSKHPKTSAVASTPLNQRSTQTLVGTSAPCRTVKRHKGIRHPKAALLITTLTLTAAIGQRFYNQPGLQVGSIAPETIVAPADVRVEDTETTESQRRDARNGALRVLKVDSSVDEEIARSLDGLLDQLGEIRRGVGDMPFVETGVLSTQVQSYLRQTEDTTWGELRSLVEQAAAIMAANPEGELDARTTNALQALTSEQQTAARELLAYGRRSSPEEFAVLLNTIDISRRAYQQAISQLQILTTDIEELAVTPQLFEITDREWAQTQLGIRRAADRILTQGIPSGLPPELLNRAVQIQLKGTISRGSEDLSQQVLLSVLQPNLVEDTDRTRIQAEMAAEAVKPVYVSAQQGEVIVKAGETITQSQFVLLDHFRLSQRRFNYWGFGGFGLIVGSGVLIFLLVERGSSHNLRQKDYMLITAMVVSTAGLNLFGAAAYGLPAFGLLSGSFYGPLLGGTLVALLSLLLPLGAAVPGISFAAGAVGALVCSVLAGRMRSREELALLGGGVGLTQGVVYLVLTLVSSPVSLSAWPGILTGAALQGIYGVLSSIAALGLSPYLEHLFDLVTPIRLAELSNPNRPMLKRLASEAPGTFQHTVFVASLAEAAARALGCNVELVRAGTLYHDIGKMHDPLGFIENQMGGPNKHDELNDPWLSASIIKKHVTEGQVMARKCRLPKALQAFIPEHQGTMQISYFYHQAKEMAVKDPTITIKEEDFRYDGPIPQSPETGIVMLADSCEAALRSLTDATPDEALAMVNRILRARWKDNQLIDSGLTREHMNVIADIFVQVWQQYNHKRIAYPKAALTPKPAV